MEMKRAICGICNKFVKIVKVDEPRELGEVVFICKEHGDITAFVEFINM
jgi:RNase P subunit RPR2